LLRSENQCPLWHRSAVSSEGLQDIFSLCDLLKADHHPSGSQRCPEIGTPTRNSNIRCMRENPGPFFFHSR
jgi:hypothetical protein